MLDIERAFLFGKKHKDTSGTHQRATASPRTTDKTHMHLTDLQIDEFIALYRHHFGVALTREEALVKGLGLCRFVELTVREPAVENGAIRKDLEYSVVPHSQRQTMRT